MGQAFSSSSSVKEDYVTTMYAVNLPDSIKPAFDSLKVEYQDTDISMDDMKQTIEKKEKDIVVVFPKNFENDVLAYNSMDAKTKAPQVEVYYNSSRTESSRAYASVTAILDQYESSMINKFDVNGNADSKYDLASDKDITAEIFSSLFPMLLMTFIFSACMSVAPESIAGEKERGTLTTVLVTPIKRSELAIGKIISLSIIAILSGISSFTGTALSLPKLMTGNAAEAVNTNVYGVQDYALLFLIVISSVLIIISVIAIISAFARNVKEAASYISPLLILVMVVSISTMFGNGVPSEVYWYFIPLYNCVQCMSSVFLFNVSVLHVIITVISNIIYSCVFVWILTKMFNSEKVMLAK
jgi:sodium transport system permease protein